MVSGLPSHQANITANDPIWDYRRIGQSLFVGLWLKACDYGYALRLRVGETWRWLRCQVAKKLKSRNSVNLKLNYDF